MDYRVREIVFDGNVIAFFPEEARIVGYDSETDALIISRKEEEDPWFRGPFCPMCDFFGVIERIKIDDEFPIELSETIFSMSMDSIGGTLILHTDNSGRSGRGRESFRAPYCPLCDRRK